MTGPLVSAPQRYSTVMRSFRVLAALSLVCSTRTPVMLLVWAPVTNRAAESRSAAAVPSVGG